MYFPDFQLFLGGRPSDFFSKCINNYSSKLYTHNITPITVFTYSRITVFTYSRIHVFTYSRISSSTYVPPALAETRNTLYSSFWLNLSTSVCLELVLVLPSRRRQPHPISPLTCCSISDSMTKLWEKTRTFLFSDKRAFNLYICMFTCFYVCVWCLRVDISKLFMRYAMLVMLWDTIEEDQS